VLVAARRGGFARTRHHIPHVVRLQISIAAFAAIANKLPATVGFQNKRAANGDWFVWPDHATVAKLKAMPGPGESYSDVIVRVARGCAGSQLHNSAN
jgi:hypothetical protein